jgi:anthranilate synthase component 1
VGYIDFTGNMDTCIALRTLVIPERSPGDLPPSAAAEARSSVYIQAGAGIVADSVPAAEYEETLNKARGMLKAIEVAERQIHPRPGARS